MNNTTSAGAFANAKASGNKWPTKAALPVTIIKKTRLNIWTDLANIIEMQEKVSPRLHSETAVGGLPKPNVSDVTGQLLSSTQPTAISLFGYPYGQAGIKIVAPDVLYRLTANDKINTTAKIKSR